MQIYLEADGEEEINFPQPPGTRRGRVSAEDPGCRAPRSVDQEISGAI